MIGSARSYVSSFDAQCWDRLANGAAAIAVDCNGL